jgi:hemerythrin
MANFAWDKSLSVGNMIIDSGHQNLIGMIDGLDYAINNSETVELVRVFERFYDFACLHFKDEEKIMQSIKFPLIAHQLEHQCLLEMFQNTLWCLGEGKDGKGFAVLDDYPEFLRGWFAMHISSGIKTLKPALKSA